MGQTGEYSDRREWAVRAFLDEARAEAFVRMAEKHLRECGLHYDSSSSAGGGYGHTVPFDPAFEADYTGARYYLITVPIDEDFVVAVADLAATYAPGNRAIVVGTEGL